VHREIANDKKIRGHGIGNRGVTLFPGSSTRQVLLVSSALSVRKVRAFICMECQAQFTLVRSYTPGHYDTEIHIRIMGKLTEMVFHKIGVFREVNRFECKLTQPLSPIDILLLSRRDPSAPWFAAMLSVIKHLLMLHEE
jgi:hypothetical protein